jgi:hypothetical protein
VGRFPILYNLCSIWKPVLILVGVQPAVFIPFQRAPVEPLKAAIPMLSETKKLALVLVVARCLRAQEHGIRVLEETPLNQLEIGSNARESSKGDISK